MRKPQLIDENLLNRVAQESLATPRLRKNFNFSKHQDTVQRFLNVMQPGTYFPPHKHMGEDAFELFVVLKGAVGLLLIDESGKVTEALELRAGGNKSGAEIPSGCVHTLVCLEPNSVLLEVKEGPFDPSMAKYLAPGFPNEEEVFLNQNSSKSLADRFVKSWESYFV